MLSADICSKCSSPSAFCRHAFKFCWVYWLWCACEKNDFVCWLTSWRFLFQKIQGIVIDRQTTVLHIARQKFDDSIHISFMHGACLIFETWYTWNCLIFLSILRRWALLSKVSSAWSWLHEAVHSGYLIPQV